MKRCFVFLATTLGVLGMDLDTGLDAVGLEKVLPPGAAHAMESPAGWVRLRGIAVPGGESAGPEDEAAVGKSQEALAMLRKQGLRTCILVRWPADGRKIYLPADLRAAYENGRRLGSAYADLVDAWEIDNEPDLGFVPESAERYTAYLKATYLGLEAGSRERGEGKKGLVIMGALGLPPGPWLERFAANDGFAYTDAFNYHYYGYADDFSGVYRQHKAAVEALTQGSGFRSQVFGEKSLPVFLTEIGYGMLGREARDTKEGRLRQWRWFGSVGRQVASLRIEAPMAFYLQPYLEYGILEFGLTVPGSQKAEGEKQKTGRWIAGGITYTPADFEAGTVEPWMRAIGKEVGGNDATPALAQWMGIRTESREQGAQSRSWQLNVARPSPVVIDFIGGEGLSFVKRYNGSFVTAREPLVGKPETGNLKPDGLAGKSPATADQSPKPPRSEEFMVHVRTSNGNLYEVYPTRKATEVWDQYLESGDNFTMSFYGRAELPWRFADNKPASLVVVMYPKQLPAVFEFRRAQLIRLDEARNPAGDRFGAGKLVLYNFSGKPLVGRLQLPDGMTRVEAGAERSPGAAWLTLAPGERREIAVAIKVPATGGRKMTELVRFEPDDPAIPPARFTTAFMADITGTKAMVVGSLLEAGPPPNRSLVTNRRRAAEEASMQLVAQGAKLTAFAQEGAKVEETEDGFAITVSSTPPGKPERVEVEIPWPQDLKFGSDEFLSMEYRLRP